ncbi:hypothetical protein VKT23_000245 [Stygiomarasmius scandens]|uniref:Uncharacterized protein n=1 Tax=Marasmiellus scandens TaxID=2682957 RepID=A0ABR1K3W9_9AGAR
MTQKRVEVVVPSLSRKEKSKYIDATSKEQEKDKKGVRFDIPDPSSDEESESEVKETTSRPFSNVKPLDVRSITSKKPHKQSEPTIRIASKPGQSSKGKSYELKPPYHKPGLVKDIADRIMDGSINITVGELNQISPGVMKEFNRRTKNRRVPVKTLGTHMVEVRDEEDPSDMKIKEEDLPITPQFYINVNDMANSRDFEVLQEAEGDLPKGSVVQRDIVEQFQADVAHEDRKKVIIVATRSESLQSIYPVINNSDIQVECVLDGGSQIVSIATEVASALGLVWDPSVVIHMQSANGQLQPTKGLARNVPFRFGELIVYLQLHVIDTPPYQVLLGRPFDSLTESNIKNFANGDQDVTLTCPNTGLKCTIGTFARGQPKRIIPRSVEPILRDATQSGDPKSDAEVEHLKRDSSRN